MTATGGYKVQDELPGLEAKAVLCQVQVFQGGPQEQGIHHRHGKLVAHSVILEGKTPQRHNITRMANHIHQLFQTRLRQLQAGEVKASETYERDDINQSHY